MKINKYTIIAILAGLILSLPVSYSLIQYKARHRGVEVNNWRVSFRTGNFGSNYLLRSAIAVASLGNAIPQEAMFFHGYHDIEGNTLNGNKQYSLRFGKDQLPPVDAFWSLTIYNSKTGFLTKNTIDRYTLGDRSEGMVLNDDGSLTILFQQDEPERDNMYNNWLPIPDEDFSVTLRCYLPKKELLGLAWIPPGIISQETQEKL